jgi:hypothetical protein
MEVVDADGYGNSIQVYVKCGGINVILSRDMEIYNSAGDFIFDESKYYTTLTGLIRETESAVKSKILPVYLADEVLPYLIMSGSEIPGEFKSSEVYAICKTIAV